MTGAPPSGEAWLSVIGIGDDGLASLGSAARALLETGEILVGGRRHLAMLEGHAAERLCWQRPLEATLDEIERRRGRRVVILASGDPMCFGVGELLGRRFGPKDMRILPAPSAYSLVCARLHWPRAEVETLSLHNRPSEILHRFLHPDARLIVLSHDGATPGVVASMLARKGYGLSRIWVFEHLGGAGERRLEGTAETWPADPCRPLNTIAVECRAGPGVPVLARTPGLPDDAFLSDGMLTKREVRAATLARLVPLPGQRLWDVGAGSGAVAIEWLRAARASRAIAIERDAARCANIAHNAAELGAPELEVVHGEAPGCLEPLEPPDAVFIGGGAAVSGLIELCWRRLRSGGRLVINVVTLEGEQALLAWYEDRGGELIRLSVARAGQIGGYRGWRTAMPVTQLSLNKP
jgi:precorrin-6B C5,15-methyltransferase / cobalt-precorrin-6B C5,C15-methyltransferase